MAAIQPVGVLYDALELLTDWGACVDEDDVAGWIYHPLYQDATQACGRLAARLLKFGPADAEAKREAAYLDQALRAILAAARTRRVGPGINQTGGVEEGGEAWDEYDMTKLAREMAQETREMWRGWRKRPDLTILLKSAWRSCLQEPRPDETNGSRKNPTSGPAPDATGPTGQN